MDDNNSNPAGSDERVGENSIPTNTFLIMEGVKAIPLDKIHITIGRGHDNTVIVDDPRVSRHHIEIRFIRGHFVLFDLGSKGGTYVNGQRTNQVILYPADLISLAGVNFVFTQDDLLMMRGAELPSPVGPGERSTATFNESK